MFFRFDVRAPALAIALLAGVLASSDVDAAPAARGKGTRAAARSADAGPGRLLRAKGSSWLWFLDSFNSRHRIVSAEVHRKWWQHGPRIEEVAPGDLERFRIGEEIAYGSNPYTYVLSREIGSGKSRPTVDPTLDQLAAVLQGSASVPPPPSSQPTPEPAPSPSPEPEPTPSVEVTPSPAAAAHHAPAEASLSVTSDPSGAQVYLYRGKELLGRHSPTPCTIKVKPGSYFVSLQLPGHLKVRKAVKAVAGETLDVAAKLQKAPGAAEGPIATSRSIPLRWSTLGEVEALFAAPAGGAPATGFAPGLTQVFRLSLPDGLDSFLPSPGADRAAGVQGGKFVYLLTLARDGAPALKEIALPEGLSSGAQISWVSDRDLLLADPSDEDRFLLNTDTLVLKKPKGPLPHAADPRPRTWVARRELARQPEALKRLAMQDVRGEADMVSGLALDSEGRLVAGVARENARQPVVISMVSGVAIKLPEPGESLTGSTISWLAGERLSFWTGGGKAFVLSLEPMSAHTAQEMATTLAGAGQAEASLAMLEKIIRHYPGTPEAQAAQTSLTEVRAKANTERAAGHLRRGKELEAQGQSAEALAELKKAAALAGTPAAAEATAALEKLEQVSGEAQLKALQEAEAKSPEDAAQQYRAALARPMPAALKARVQQGLNALQKRLDSEKAARERAEEDQALLRAAAAQSAGDLEKARLELKAGLAKRPGAERLRTRLAQIDEKLALAAQEEKQRKTFAHYSAAVALVQKGKLAEAAEEAGAALKENPAHAPSQNLLSEISAAAVRQAGNAPAPLDAQGNAQMKVARDALAAGQLAAARDAVGRVLGWRPASTEAGHLVEEIRAAEQGKAPPSPSAAVVAQASPAATEPDATPSPASSGAAPAVLQTGPRVDGTSGAIVAPSSAVPSPAPEGDAGAVVLAASDVPLNVGTRWVYALGPGSLTRTVLKQVAVNAEPAVLVSESVELHGRRIEDRFEVILTRPDQHVRVARGTTVNGPFQALRVPQVLFRFPVRLGGGWLTGQGHVQVTDPGVVTTPAGSFPHALNGDELVKQPLMVDVAARQLVYACAWAPGVGLVRKQLKRVGGTTRPVLELTGYTAGTPPPPASLAATPGTTAPVADLSGLPVITLSPPEPEERGPRDPGSATPPTGTSAAATRKTTTDPEEAALEEAEQRLIEKGDSHFQMARRHLERRFPLQARAEIEAALSFDPSRSEYLQLKDLVLAAVMTNSPYRPEQLALGMDEADMLLTYGTPDRIEPSEGTLQLDGGQLPYQRIFTYRGVPNGPPPADGEVEGADETVEDTAPDRPQMARWRIYVNEGRVVARQLSYRGEFGRGSFPTITKPLPADLVTRPHGESAGPLANTRHLTWDLGRTHVKACVLAVPRRRYVATKGYTFEPPRSVADYRIIRLISWLDPELEL